MVTTEKALKQLGEGHYMSFEAREAILSEVERLKTRNTYLESELKQAAVITGQISEDITRLINNQSVLATIGSNSLLACGREE